eukprot:m.646430 g.646430  ORF g.646430 m.646430 type:complete len:495 (-) comp58366_c0_seq14:88-1572(-)
MYGSMRILSENLLSALVAIRSLRDAGSKQDIIILTIEEPTNETRRYLAAQSIQIITVPPIHSGANDEEANTVFHMLKLRAFQLTDYKALIYFDREVGFLKSADWMFEPSRALVGATGDGVPFSTHLFAVKPSLEAAINLCDLYQNDDFDEQDGWLEHGTIPNYTSTFHVLPKSSKHDWSFSRANLDQGLLYFYFDRHLSNATILPEAQLRISFTHLSSELFSPASMPPDVSEEHRRCVRAQVLAELRPSKSTTGLPTSRALQGCNSAPCDMLVSSCVETARGHDCVCKERFPGPPSQDGHACIGSTYLEIISPSEHALLVESEDTRAFRSVALSVKACSRACLAASVELPCNLIAFEASSGSCLSPISTPKYVLTKSDSSLAVFVRTNGTVHFELAEFTKKGKTFGTIANETNRIFHYNFLKTIHECQALCSSLFVECSGILWLKGVYTTCIGLADLGAAAAAIPFDNNARNSIEGASDAVPISMFIPGRKFRN